MLPCYLCLLVTLLTLLTHYIVLFGMRKTEAHYFVTERYSVFAKLASSSHLIAYFSGSNYSRVSCVFAFLSRRELVKSCSDKVTTIVTFVRTVGAVDDVQLVDHCLQLTRHVPANRQHPALWHCTCQSYR